MEGEKFLAGEIPETDGRMVLIMGRLADLKDGQKELASSIEGIRESVSRLNCAAHGEKLNSLAETLKTVKSDVETVKSFRSTTIGIAMAISSVLSILWAVIWSKLSKFM